MGHSSNLLHGSGTHPMHGCCHIQLEERADLQQQYMRMVVLMHQQYALDSTTHAFTLILFLPSIDAPYNQWYARQALLLSSALNGHAATNIHASQTCCYRRIFLEQRRLLPERVRFKTVQIHCRHDVCNGAVRDG
jgi:hypothetical protein